MHIRIYLQEQICCLQLPSGTYGTHGDPVNAGKYIYEYEYEYSSKEWEHGHVWQGESEELVLPLQIW